ncbi:MAG: hypothetical protein KC800_30605 [Candidatus Eremiobacteraeota bacterium]|nr:hypothetical protein [Candidatus Eremiobacteraeota bacterium]
MQKRDPKDLIGPTFKKNQNRVHCVPEGPTAELSSSKPTQSMDMARRLLGGKEPKVEGTLIKGPLQQTPMLPPGAPLPRKPVPKTPRPELSVDPQAVVRMTHIDSYQTLMRNDRMEKPMVKGWSDEDT